MLLFRFPLMYFYGGCGLYYRAAYDPLERGPSLVIKMWQENFSDFP